MGVGGLGEIRYVLSVRDESCNNYFLQLLYNIKWILTLWIINTIY